MYQNIHIKSKKNSLHENFFRAHISNLKKRIYSHISLMTYVQVEDAYDVEKLRNK